MDVGNLISLVPQPFLNPTWTPGSCWFACCWSLFSVHILLILVMGSSNFKQETLSGTRRNVLFWSVDLKQTTSYFSERKKKKKIYLGSARNCYLRSATLESPHRSRKEYFYRGQEGRQSAWLFIDWVLARKEEESSCWPLIITGYKSSPCWCLCNWGFCLLNFYSSNFNLLPQTYQCLFVVFSSGQK